MHQPSARRMPKCHPVLLLGRASKTPQTLGDFKITDPWINTWQRLSAFSCQPPQELHQTSRSIESAGRRFWLEGQPQPRVARSSPVARECTRWYFAWCFWELGPSRPKASHSSELGRA